jgi:hypothetical protein
MTKKLLFFDTILILLLIAVQAFFCYNFYSREIAWYPPGNFDQCYYLATAYEVTHNTHANGLLELARAVASRFHFTGMALPIEGAISGLILGGARLPELFVLFLAYCAVQIVGFITARKLWGGREYGYIMLGLILCQTTPWYWSGGLFDFRLDFMIYCLYGIWVCAAMRSNLFLERGWAIACGLIGGLVVMNRFVTIVYLLVISIAFAVVCVAAQRFWRTKSDVRQRTRSRLVNICISTAVSLVIGVPFLLRSWAQWFEYYVVGHGMTQIKNVYAEQLGVTDLTSNLLFYPRSILRDHWGLTFIFGSIVVLGISLVVRFLVRRAASDQNIAAPQQEAFPLQIIFLAGTILGPIVALTSDLSKNPCVGSVVGVPSALLVVCIAARIAPSLQQLASSPVRRLLTVSAVLTIVIGLGNEFTHLSSHLPEYYQREDLNRLLELQKFIVNYASDRGWQTPGVSFDVISPWLEARSFTDTGYERLRKLVEFHPMIGDGILGVDKTQALSLLQDSDFAIFTNSPTLGFTRSGLSIDASTDAIREFPKILLRFPTSQKIASYRPELLAWAEKNMVLIKTMQFENFDVKVYARSTPQPSDH